MKHTRLKWMIPFLLLPLLGIGIYYFVVQDNTKADKPSKQQRIDEAIKYHNERTKDLKLGYVPQEGLSLALEQTRALQAEYALKKNKFDKARFRERGPKNIAGRTRTILVDRNDPSGKSMFVGGVTGGLWKTEDITNPDPQWRPVNDYLENINVGCLVQSKNDPNLMYMGTGEVYGVFRGNGIYRSVDGGNNWKLMGSTSVGVAGSTFTYVQDLYLDENDRLFAATISGLYYTDDNGRSWEQLVDGTTHEIERGGSWLYVATNSEVYRGNINSLQFRSVARNSGFPRGFSRIEISVCEATPSTIYLLGNQRGSASNIYASYNSGENWFMLGIPSSVEGLGNFARGQGGYDLTIAVDPFDCSHLIVGGIDPYESRDGGNTWRQIGHWYGGFGLQYIHADQHAAVFDNEREGVIYLGNDGGIFRSTDGGRNYPNRNLGYNVTQFYAGAIHPEAYSNYILGGTQDNGSLRIDDFDVSNAVEVLGGDGFFCHIDQNEPEYQMVSLYFAAYSLSTNGGKSFSGGAAMNGSFSSPSDYDNDANILYSQTFDGDFYRWKVPTGQPELVDVNEIDVNVSTVYADPSTLNRVYIGDFGSGTLLKIDNAHEGDAIDATILRPSSSGTISGVVVEKDNPDHILVTISNYGIRNSVLESTDGGASWTGVEGNLPDMPVYSVLFSPDDPTQAVIATELGVWFTEKLTGDDTEWIPPLAGRGLPLVRTEMLQYRESDKVVLAATYGRGMFTSDVFSDPKAIFDLDRIGYLNTPISFEGEYSYAADEFLWTFGDGGQDTLGNTTHVYDEIGEYDISFTINDELTENASLKILPDRDLPYELNSEKYSGGFDNNPEDYGVYTLGGSSFERGNSTEKGKNGTNSGDNAFVIGLEEEFYQRNTHTMLYLPNFDFSEKTIYEFSFWYKAALQVGFDGFLVEYSTDRGKSWRSLGSEQKTWYDSRVEDNGSGYAFPAGTAFFGRNKSKFEQAYLDISFLAGNPDVAFRFVFKSNDVGSHAGLVLDDVEIKKFNGKAETAIVNIQADYSEPSRIQIDWTTQPEYYAERFFLERSFNGKTFERVGNKVSPTGVLTARTQNYEIETEGGRDLYFFRIRSINENSADGYYHEFTSPVVVVNRNKDEADLEALKIFPNPFVDAIEMTFTGVVEDDMTVQLFDMAGRLVYENTIAVAGIYTKIDINPLPAGAYVLRYKIGDRAAKTQKVNTNGEE